MKYLETYSQSSDWDTEEHHPLNISSVTDKLLMVLFFTFLLSKARNFHCFINTAASQLQISLTMISLTHLHAALGSLRSGDMVRDKNSNCLKIGLNSELLRLPGLIIVQEWTSQHLQQSISNFRLSFNECYTNYLDRFIDIDPKSDNICVFLPSAVGIWGFRVQRQRSAEQTCNNLFWHQAPFLLSNSDLNA